MNLNREIDRIFASVKPGDNGRTAATESHRRVSERDKAAPTVSVTRIADLLAEPDEDTPWLIDALLPAGGVSLLASKPKVGKSTLARCCALAVARGDRFLGRATHGGPALYLGLEDKRAETARHFRDLGAVAEPLFVVTDPPEVDSHKLGDTLIGVIRETAARLCIVDTLAQLARIKDFSDYGEVVRKLEPMTAVARATDCHVMLLHHAGKTSAGRDDGDLPLGSTALFGAVDTLLVLKRDKDGGRTLSTRQRYGPDMDATVLAFDRETRAITAGDSVAMAQQAEIADQVVAALAASGEPMTTRDIRKEIGAGWHSVHAALDHLYGAGAVGRTGSGKRGDPFRFCTLNSPLRVRAEFRNENPPGSPEAAVSTGTDEKLHSDESGAFETSHGLGYQRHLDEVHRIADERQAEAP